MGDRGTNGLDRDREKAEAIVSNNKLWENGLEASSSMPARTRSLTKRGKLQIVSVFFIFSFLSFLIFV